MTRRGVVGACVLAGVVAAFRSVGIPARRGALRAEREGQESRPDWSSWVKFVTEAGQGKVDLASALAAVGNATEVQLLQSSVRDLAQGWSPSTTSRSRVTASELSRFEALSRRSELSGEFLETTARCGELSAAAYANEAAKEAFEALGCAYVAGGASLDVRWHVVDSARCGVLERHVVIRGFDASDSTVDRLALVRRILTAAPAQVSPADGSATQWKKRAVHQGFLTMARALLSDVDPYLFQDTARRKLFFTGHSIGGSLCVLLFLLSQQRKATPSVFTFAALPCVTPGFASNDAVHGFVQPWDPLVRWYTRHDPCYPLVSDVARDGVTLFASGPPRVLRPITRAVLQAAEDWPSVRELYKDNADQNYRPLGDQYLILPDKARFVADRNVAWQIDVPQPAALAKLREDDLHDVLTDLFPLDEFSISLLPAALRSFVHHFFPAYSLTLNALYANPPSAAILDPPPQTTATSSSDGEASASSPDPSGSSFLDERPDAAPLFAPSRTLPSTDQIAAAITDILSFVASISNVDDDDDDSGSTTTRTTASAASASASAAPPTRRRQRGSGGVGVGVGGGAPGGGGGGSAP